MPDLPSVFPRTKLMPPELRHDFIPRPRLDRFIEKMVASHRLTLIAAPAGYGKTTAALSWSGFTRKFHVLWVTIDPQDNHPLQFLRLVVAALQQIKPDFGKALLPTLAGQTSASLVLERAFGILVNAILDDLPDSVALIIDDLQLVTNDAIFAGLDFFIAHLPPQMRLLTIARFDPPLALPLLRSRGHLAEIRPPDLRFTQEEAVRLMQDGLKIQLSLEDQRALYEDTQGWVAGLRLLGGLGKDGTLSDHGLSATTLVKRGVFDLLVAEVLSKQGKEIRNFLLETSILEELTPELCARVTGNPDAYLLLEEIYRRNLFLTAAFDKASGDTFFRYHDLFAQVLRETLRRERSADIEALHRRAGINHPDPVRAVAHFLAAKDYDGAARRMAAEASDLFASAHFRQLQEWVERLPDSVREGYPWLAYYLGACQWVAYDHQAAIVNLERALGLFEAQGDPTGQGECLVLLSTIFGTFGDMAKATQLSNAAEPLPISTASRVQLNLNRAWLEMEEVNKDLSTDFDTALELVESSQDPGAFQIATMSLREIFCVMPEGQRAARRLLVIIEGQSSIEQIGVAQNSYYGLTAALEYFQGNVEGAIEAANRSFAINKRLGGMPILQGILILLMALAERLQERWDAVDKHITSLEGLTHVVPGWHAGLLFPSGLLHWERGDIDKAAQIRERMDARPVMSERAVEGFSRHALQGLIDIRNGRKASGIRALQKAVDVQRAHRYVYYLGDMRMALAYAHLQNRAPEAASVVARPALDEWSRANLPGPILTAGQVIAPPVLELAIKHNVQAEFAQQVLAILQQLTKPRPVVIPDTGETLTVREFEVLRQIAAGASNQAIADELIVSLPTVKTHVSRILAKLDVRSRGQAVARARELRML